MEEFNKEQLTTNLETILYLEYLGIHFEDTREEKDPYGFHSKTIFLFSVPESSTIELEDEDLNVKIKTANALKNLAKESIIDMMIESFKTQFGEYEEFIEEIRNNTSDYFKFYAKVRKGEIWSKELGDNRIKELTSELKKASEYKEI